MSYTPLCIYVYIGFQISYITGLFHIRCNFYSSANGVRVGQNLGATTGSNHSIERMVHLFMNEKADYNYTEHKWTNVVGHYLQVSLFFKSNNIVACFGISIDL